MPRQFSPPPPPFSRVQNEVGIECNLWFLPFFKEHIFKQIRLKNQFSSIEIIFNEFVLKMKLEKSVKVCELNQTDKFVKKYFQFTFVIKA